MLIIVLILSACGPSAEEVAAATIGAEATRTQLAGHTASAQAGATQAANTTATHHAAQTQSAAATAAAAARATATVTPTAETDAFYSAIARLRRVPNTPNMAAVFAATPTPTYGPESGEVEHDSDRFPELSCIGEGYTDFAASVRFRRPYAAGRWDVSFFFRDSVVSVYALIFVDDDGWVFAELNPDESQLAAVSGDALEAGTFDTDDEHLFEIVAVDDEGYVALNGEFLAELDLSTFDDASGDVCLGIGWFDRGYERSGQAVPYTGLTVWELRGSLLGD